MLDQPAQIKFMWETLNTAVSSSVYQLHYEPVLDLALQQRSWKTGFILWVTGISPLADFPATVANNNRNDSFIHAYCNIVPLWLLKNKEQKTPTIAVFLTCCLSLVFLWWPVGPGYWGLDRRTPLRMYLYPEPLSLRAHHTHSRTVETRETCKLSFKKKKINQSINK